MMEPQEIERGLKTGFTILQDPNISIPITYADGVRDLKQLIIHFLQGQFTINTEPQRQPQQPPPGSSTADIEIPDGAGGDGGDGGGKPPAPGNGGDPKPE